MVNVTEREGETLHMLNERFTYELDKDRYGATEVWRVPAGSRINGDCEDYALALGYMLAGSSTGMMLWWLVTGHIQFERFVHPALGGHVGLRYRSFTGEVVYADNITARWNDGTKLVSYGWSRRGRYAAVTVLAKLLRGVVTRAVKAPFRGWV